MPPGSETYPCGSIPRRRFRAADGLAYMFPGKAKTELCAAVSNLLSPRFFRYVGLNGMPFGAEAPAV